MVLILEFEEESLFYILLDVIWLRLASSSPYPLPIALILILPWRCFEGCL
jgi:hypothetical protein